MEPREDVMLTALIRSQAKRYAPSEALTERIAAQLRESAAPPTQRSATPAPPWRRWFEALALYGAGVATAWVAASALLVAPAPDTTATQVAASHVRSLLVDHLSDVQSGDRHTVKPWFAGKLDFSPPVIDLAAEGFPLAGGRLDYLDGRAVAALVYKPGAHVVNLFVWPAPGRQVATAPRLVVYRGYNLAHWSAGGMQAWAISDMSADELRGFAELVRARMAAPEPKVGGG